tara:strand:+ start:142763 stop:143182 length:420 start_codon:yes stop_codon:yes gene_type:complete
MHISGLSLSECDELKALLDAEGIKYSVVIDEELVQLNEAQKTDTLAHYLPGRVSTNLLKVEIESNEFAKISENTLKLMQELGLYSENHPHPSEFEVYNEEDPEYLKEHKLLKAKRLNYILIMTSLISFLTYIIFSFFED